MKAFSAMYIVNVEVAVLRDGRYLATTRGAGEDYGAGWVGFPGGKVDPDLAATNVLEETARREVQEEVGLNLQSPIVYVESHTFGTAEMPVLDVVMMALADEGETAISDPDEVAEVEWLTFDEMLSHPGVQAWTRTSLGQVELKRRELGW
jgi:8-oxo-dGTP diphosphatase